MREPPCGGFPWSTRQNWTLTKLKAKPEKVSSYLKDVVNYLDKFGDGIFVYLKGGNYPIEIIWRNTVFANLPHNGTICSPTAVTKGGIVAIHHSVIITVKIDGKSAWSSVASFLLIFLTVA